MATLRRKVSPISRSAITFTVSVVDVSANKNGDIGPCLQSEWRIMRRKRKQHKQTIKICANRNDDNHQVAC